MNDQEARELLTLLRKYEQDRNPTGEIIAIQDVIADLEEST